MPMLVLWLSTVAAAVGDVTLFTVVLPWRGRE